MPTRARPARAPARPARSASRGRTPRRRTQEERSHETRARILDAALDCLGREGWAGTTTIAVAERAGVSRGAQLHHFPTRAALVSAALRHLYADLTAQYEKAFASIGPEADRLDSAIELLWRVMCDPRLAAVTELTVAARTDAELRAEVAAVALAHRENIGRLALSYFPDAAARPDFDTHVDVVIDALQGLVLRQGLHGDGPFVRRSLRLVKRLATASIRSTRARARS